MRSDAPSQDELEHRKASGGEWRKNGRDTVMSKDTITTAVRLELLKPLSESWDDFGPRLRDLRSVSHRMLNAGMLGLVADLHAHERRAREGKLKPGEKLKLYSYPHVLAELASFGKWAADKAAKAKGEEKARLERIVMLCADVPGDIKAYANYTVDAKFRHWMKHRADERLPMYKRGAPIFLPGVGCRILEVSERNVRLSLKLRGKGRVEVVAVPVSGSNWQTMRLVGAGEAKSGDCKIVYDERKRKWFAFLAVTRPRPEPAPMDNGVVVAVNRGRHNFLYAVSNNGHVAVVPGDSILKFKQAMFARRKSLGRHRTELGAGARGHGKKRREARYAPIERTESNFVRTRCQQSAAVLEKLCVKSGAGMIRHEDFNTIDSEDLRYVPSWPWYQLKTAIEWTAHKSGRRVESVPSEYLSSECPRCGNLDTSQAKWTGTFHCARCSLERDNDFVACLNMLRRSGADMRVWDGRFKRERELADALKEPAE